MTEGTGNGFLARRLLRPGSPRMPSLAPLSVQPFFGILGRSDVRQSVGVACVHDVSGDSPKDARPVGLASLGEAAPGNGGSTMPGIDFVAMKNLVTLKETLGLIGWAPQRREPSSLRGYCPLHSCIPHPSRSFAVSGEVWYCHSCKRGGDALDLYGALYGCQPWEAARRLCNALGRPIPWLRRRRGPRVSP